MQGLELGIGFHVLFNKKARCETGLNSNFKFNNENTPVSQRSNPKITNIVISLQKYPFPKKNPKKICKFNIFVLPLQCLKTNIITELKILHIFPLAQIVMVCAYLDIWVLSKGSEGVFIFFILCLITNITTRQI